MNSVANSIVEMLGAQVLQVTLLIAVVALAAALLARNHSHLAHALWIIVLLKCVTPPVWNCSGGVFCWLQPGHAEQAGHEQAASVFDATPLVASTTGSYSSRTPVGTFMLEEETGTPGTTARTRPHAPALEESISPEIAVRRFTPAMWIMFAWLLGAATILLATARRCFVCLRKIKNSPQVHDPRLQQQFKQLARRLGLKCKVRLFVTTEAIGPAVIGVLRPIVVVPAVMVQGKSAAGLESILAHELIHVRRGDLWIGMFQILCQAVWWFHPLVWLANRLVTREAEKCCDEEVIAGLRCDPARYATALLDVLELKHSLKSVPAFPGVRPVDVTSKRMERIMKLGQGCRLRTPWWCWITMLVGAAVTLPGAAFVVSADETEASSAIEGEPSSQPAKQTPKEPGKNDERQEAEPPAIGSPPTDAPSRPGIALAINRFTIQIHSRSRSDLRVSVFHYGSDRLDAKLEHARIEVSLKETDKGDVASRFSLSADQIHLRSDKSVTLEMKGDVKIVGPAVKCTARHAQVSLRPKQASDGKPSTVARVLLDGDVALEYAGHKATSEQATILLEHDARAKPTAEVKLTGDVQVVWKTGTRAESRVRGDGVFLQFDGSGSRFRVEGMLEVTVPKAGTEERSDASKERTTNGLEPPSDDQVLQAVDEKWKAEDRAPLAETRRDNVRIMKEKISEYTDSPRFVPLVGPARLHHVRYKCTIYFTEVRNSKWPTPHTIKNDRIDVVYLDRQLFLESDGKARKSDDKTGQVLPPPYDLKDDVQYFPAGPKFKPPSENAVDDVPRSGSQR